MCNQADKGTDVLLVSLKAASLGLNLTAANYVVLMDLWWNPAVEEQAIDRAHRIGQTRTVRVMRLTIAGVPLSPLLRPTHLCAAIRSWL